MKKLFLIVALVCFVPALALSQIPLYPPAGYEVESFHLDTLTGQWVANPLGDPSAIAQCWASLEASGSCNKDWHIDVKVHASIAQWSSWHMTGTRWDWFVKKPGDYAADCISGSIASNQNVLVDYHDFGDLVAEVPANSIDDTIEVWYAVSASGTPYPLTSPNWVRSWDLNQAAEWDTLYDSAALHAGITWKLWNRIHVSNCNSACEYNDDAWISLQLLGQKPWIDRTTGLFQRTAP